MRYPVATTRHHLPPLIVAGVITAIIVPVVVLHNGALVEPSPILTAAIVFGYTSYSLEFIGELLWGNVGDYSPQ